MASHRVDPCTEHGNASQFCEQAARKKDRYTSLPTLPRLASASFYTVHSSESAPGPTILSFGFGGPLGEPRVTFSSQEGIETGALPLHSKVPWVALLLRVLRK
jgi:hypothetical protein